MSMEGIPKPVREIESEKSKIVERIEREAGVPRLADTLIEIPSSQLQSLLLEVTEKRAGNIGSRELNAALENNPFVEISKVEQVAFLDFDRTAYDVLPRDYVGIELSPLVPFATNNVLTGISQKSILSTIRTTETISDPTTALALYLSQERSRKIKVDPKDVTPVRMATSQRVIRQGKAKREGYSQHFRLFTVGIAGRDIGNRSFEKSSFKEHLGYFCKLLQTLDESDAFVIKNIRVAISDVSENPDMLLDIIDETVLAELREEFPHVVFEKDIDRRSNYYKNLCHAISAENRDGKRFSVAGGGITNWTEILTGSQKERLLVGSVGSETICTHFRKQEENS